MATKKHSGNVASVDEAIRREKNSNSLRTKQEAERSRLESQLEKSGVKPQSAEYQQALYRQTREHEADQDRKKRGEP